MSLRDVTIARDGKRSKQVRMTSCTGSAQRILGDFEKSVSGVESCHVRRRLAFACSRRPWAGVARDGGGGGGGGQMKKPE